MPNAQSTRLYNRDTNDDDRLVRQLEREILCLERQVSRLQLLSTGLEDKTLSTYREMIAARREMLSELSY